MAWGMRNIVICLFGSSIMEGRIGVERAEDRYYAMMQRKLSERFPEVCFAVVNAAVGGASLRELMAEFPDTVIPKNPDYCLFMPGFNNTDMENPGRTLRPGELEALMAEFQRTLPARCRRVGVMPHGVIDRYHSVTNNPVWREYLAERGGLNNSLAPERAAIAQFFAENRYPVIDLFSLIGRDPERYLLRSDGIHLSPEGHRLFGEAAFRMMEELLIKNHQTGNGRQC